MITYNTLSYDIFQVGSLEGYCESLPQFLILTVLAIYKGGLLNCDMKDIPRFYSDEKNSTEYAKVECGEDNYTYPMYDVEMYKLLGMENPILFGAVGYIPQYYWFNWSYNLTMISSTFAILRFLDFGPARILQRSGWRNWIGYGSAFVSVLWSLYMKAIGLGTGGYVMHMFYNLILSCNNHVHQKGKQ